MAMQALAVTVAVILEEEKRERLCTAGILLGIAEAEGVEGKSRGSHRAGFHSGRAGRSFAGRSPVDPVPVRHQSSILHVLFATVAAVHPAAGRVLLTG